MPGLWAFPQVCFIPRGSYAGFLKRSSTWERLRQPAASSIAPHMRDEGSHNVGLFVALNEAIQIGRAQWAFACRFHTSSVWDRRSGAALVMCWICSSAQVARASIPRETSIPTSLALPHLTGALFPRWALEGGRDATLRRLAHTQDRRQLHADITANFRKWSDPEGIAIARFVPDPHFEGMNMVQIATELGCDPAEAALRLYERAEVGAIARAMQDADVEAIACHPLIAVEALMAVRWRPVACWRWGSYTRAAMAPIRVSWRSSCASVG